MQSWPDLVTDWSAGSRPRMHWDDYQNYETINGYLDELAKKHLDFVRVVNIGPSFEGRQMKVLRVGKAGERAPNVWIEGGKRIHVHMLLAGVKFKELVLQVFTHESGSHLPWSRT